MRKEILLSLLFILLSYYSCFCQKMDTVIIQLNNYYLVEEIEYHENDKVKSIRYSTKSRQALLTPDKMMDYYMRDISINKEGDEFYEVTDSLKSFGMNGLLLQEEFYGRSPVIKIYHYNEFMKLDYLEKEDVNGIVYESDEVAWEENFYYIEGRIGTKQNTSITLINRSSRIRNIGLVASNGIVIPEIELKPFETKDIDVNVDISSKDDKLLLSINTGKKIIEPIAIKIQGFDLTDLDFTKIDELQKVYDFIDRKELNIKLEGYEKELRISGEGVNYRQGLSRIINTIDISNYKSGIYMIEIINLSDNTVKYCQMKK